MRIVTWNINSVRARLQHVARFTEDYAPDVICLQETKAQDSDFPMKEIKAMGFDHVEILGQKSYNGVAILSKHKLSDVGTHDWVGKSDCRHLFATLPNGTILHNFYVPAGGDEPNPDVNDKFAHKLEFLDEMTRWFPDRHSIDQSMILMGDLNIAPLENDVWNHKQLLKIVSHTPIEVEKLTNIIEKFGWIDAMREIIPTDEKLYTWWSYRARDWLAANKGRRLDHMWVTPPLRAKVNDIKVVLDARGWEKPSDHAPVILDMAS